MKACPFLNLCFLAAHVSAFAAAGLKIKDVAKKLGKRMATGAGIITNEATEGEEIELQVCVVFAVAAVLRRCYVVCGLFVTG